MLSAAWTDAGGRAAGNQDTYGLRVTASRTGETAGFAVVCDGVGGLSAGERASGAVVRALLDWYDGHVEQLFTRCWRSEDVAAAWDGLLDDVNGRLYRQGRQSGLTMGTTVAAVLLAGGTAYAMNVGDSRIYRLTSQLRQLSRDHTLAQREVEAGRMSPAAALRTPKRNVLLRCVGGEAAVTAQHYSEPVPPGAAYVLCSDGFYRTLTGNEWTAALRPGAAQEELQSGLERLFRLTQERGERDNATAVLLWTRPPEPDREQTVDLALDLRTLRAEMGPARAETPQV